MSKQNVSGFKFIIWIPLFIILLSSIPLLVINGQKDSAKILGIVTIILTAFAIRRWMYITNKIKGRPSKINLNQNDRFWLNQNIAFYSKLNSSDKKIFEDRIGLFVADILITEIGKEIPEREVCLYVASSAVIAFWGLPYWNYGRLSEVLIYPENFNDDNSLDVHGNVLGKVHHGGLMDTTMILSQPALIAGFKNSNDKSNVGIHEFAHLIDKADGEIDGVPVGMNKQDKMIWTNLIAKEIEHIKDHRSDINIYGATNKAEFFAVIIEYYKERPDILSKKHPEIFEILDKYFTSETK